MDDAALLRTREIVTHLLAGRPDVLGAMAEAEAVVDQASPDLWDPPDPEQPDEPGVDARRQGRGAARELSRPVRRP